jgi:mono/diheme cytochrome c family protein
MITLGGALWYAFLPPSARAAMEAAPALNVFMGLLFLATGVVFVLLYIGPYRNPGWIRSPGFAASVLLFGVIGLSTGEFIREAVRKPYVCYNVVLGSQELPGEVPAIRARGYLESGLWTKAYVRVNYPKLLVDGHVDRRQLSALAEKDQAALGGVIFQYHCNDCHAIRHGISPIAPLIQGWTPGMIRDLVQNLDRARFTMPPWSGTPEEASLLAAYLADVSRREKPAGMLPAALHE